MKQPEQGRHRKPGRPLSFDPEAVLGPAMLLFWRHGYEATSLAALTRAMGITPPSLYAAFGDKKGLFRAAVRRYLTEPLSPLDVIARAASAEAAVHALLDGAAIAYTGTETPAGCLLATSAIAVSPEAEDVREELAAVRQSIEATLRDKIAGDVATGALAQGADPDLLATYVMTVVQGLATLARDGATRAKLQKVARFAMRIWPAPESPAHATGKRRPRAA